MEGRQEAELNAGLFHHLPAVKASQPPSQGRQQPDINSHQSCQRPNSPGLEVLLQSAQTLGDSSPPEPSTLALQAEARLVRAFLENTNDPGTTRGCREGSFEVLNSEDPPNRIIHSQLSPGNGLRSFQPAFQSRVSIAKEQQTFEESPPGQGTRLNN